MGKLLLLMQSLYHEYESGLNWAILKQCYFHEDLPKEVAHLCPCSPEQNEVHFSCSFISLISPFSLYEILHWYMSTHLWKLYSDLTSNCRCLFLCDS